jgi:hypothetical protein
MICDELFSDYLGLSHLLKDLLDQRKSVVGTYGLKYHL